jgi:hypothetical protein
MNGELDLPAESKLIWSFNPMGPTCKVAPHLIRVMPAEGNHGAVFRTDFPCGFFFAKRRST